MKPEDPGIAVLLELHGSIIVHEGGYWVKFEAWAVPHSAWIPHGVRYSLTLHDRHGRRLLGYDNAHAAPVSARFKYAGRVLPYDHRHRHSADRGVPYGFVDAQTLLNDFFEDMDRVLMEERAR